MEKEEKVIVKNNNNKIIGLLVAIIILLLILIILFSISTIKILKEDIKKNEPANNVNTNEVKKENIESEISSIEKTEDKIIVKLPKINKDTTDANKINSDITNRWNEIIDQVKSAYADGSLNNDKEYNIKYEYLIKNAVLAVYVYSESDAIIEWRSSGNGLYEENYFYDIENDKELNMSEAAEKMGITELGGANSYSDLVLDEKHSCDPNYIYMVIKNNNATIKYNVHEC